MILDNSKFILENKKQPLKGDPGQLFLIPSGGAEIDIETHTDFKITNENMDELVKMRKAEENPL